MSILQEKDNCWKIAPVKRGGFLIDAAAYFKNLYEAILQAEESIFILGWDIDTRTKLIPHPLHSGVPIEFGAFLSFLIKQKKNLHIHILIWDYYSILAFERELFVKLKLGWMSAKRIQFHLDSEFPMGASHHQKIVVIDDRVAFCGGIDITSERWDTPAHRKKNKLRKNHLGTEYEPQHDVQIMVEGEAAYHLGRLARIRWHRSTGRNILIKKWDGQKNGFEDLDWDFEDATVGISRTEPAYKNHRKIKEVEQLFIDLIRNTRHHLYIENQYFTSDAVFKAFEKSLSQKTGPEITFILPKTSPYQMEKHTMGALQSIYVKKLKDIDRHNRIGIFSPVYKNDEEKIIKVHSKVMVCDHLYARVGSANMSNRSLGLDTECDLTLDGSKKKILQRKIKKFKTRLLSEHLGEPIQSIEQLLDSNHSINTFIRNHTRQHRYLEELSIKEAEENIITQSELTDLEGPLEIDRVLDSLGPEINREKWKFLRSLPFIIGTIIGLFLLGLAIWNYLPIFKGTEIEQFLLRFEHRKIQPLWIFFIYAIASILFIPINILILATASIYQGFTAFIYATIGSVINAGVSYGVGYLLGKQTIQKIFFERMNRIAKKLEKKGLLPIIIVRLMPIAPYSIVNVIAGAFKVSFKNYLLGTFIGMLPGTIVLIVFQRNLLGILKEPKMSNIIALIAVSLFILFGFFFFRKRLSTTRRK